MEIIDDFLIKCILIRSNCSKLYYLDVPVNYQRRKLTELLVWCCRSGGSGRHH